ncbi:MAG: hypothetical protein U0519_03000, partial [Candidatus Gracilibacteria bacterium]
SEDEIIITLVPSYSLSPLQIHNTSIILNEGGAAMYIVGPLDELSLFEKRRDLTRKKWLARCICKCEELDCRRNSDAKNERKEYEIAIAEEKIFLETVPPQAIKQILFYLSHYQKVCGLRIEGNLDKNLHIGEKIE